MNSRKPQVVEVNSQKPDPFITSLVDLSTTFDLTKWIFSMSLIIKKLEEEEKVIRLKTLLNRYTFI